MALTNEPRNSSLAGLSDHQLLVVIATELRLFTALNFETALRENEIEGFRAEIMNETEIVDTDSTTAVLDANK